MSKWRDPLFFISNLLFFIGMDKREDEELDRIKEKKLKEIMRDVSHKTEEVKPIIKPSGKPLDLTDATFKKFTEDNNLAVVDCWAPWCGPCRFVSPVIEELAGDYKGRIAFGKLNMDENNKVARQYGIMSIPTLLVFKNGKLIDQIVGAMPRQSLEPRIVRHL